MKTAATTSVTRTKENGSSIGDRREGGAGRPKKVMSFFNMHALVRIVFLAPLNREDNVATGHLDLPYKSRTSFFEGEIKKMVARSETGERGGRDGKKK